MLRGFVIPPLYLVASPFTWFQTQVLFAFHAANDPLSIPLSLASLRLAQDNIAQLTGLWSYFVQSGDGLSSKLTCVRDMYEVVDIPNQLVDGAESYPMEDHDPSKGMSVEFR